jgi:methionyl aminopeptidase
VLHEGDIISVDVGAIHKGYHGDSAWSYPVGAISEEARRLLEVTEQSLQAGIDQVRPGHTFGDVSRAIQQTVEAAGFSVVREYTGHGIGRQMHEEPQILHYIHAQDKVRHLVLKPGMTFAIEPMVNAGTWRTRVLDDKWTVVTMDGQLSAHFEHTLAVTENGVEILTKQA